MPGDRHRVNGPEVTQPLHTLFQEASLPVALLNASSAATTSAGKKHSQDKRTKVERSDGRAPQDLRPTFMSVGTVSQANGSAYLEVGGTKVMCAVYGPREYTRAPSQFSDIALLTCDVKRAPFASPLGHKRIAQSQQESRLDEKLSLEVFTALESSVLLEKYAKSSIDIYVTILGDDGCVLAAAINCSTLALADAGIEMNDLVTACGVSLQADGAIFVDPTFEECASATSVCTQALRTNANLVTLAVQSGTSNFKQSVHELQACSSGCAQIHSLIQQTLAQSVVEKSALRAAQK